MAGIIPHRYAKLVFSTLMPRAILRKMAVSASKPPKVTPGTRLY